jgi:hypothetical protein
LLDRVTTEVEEDRMPPKGVGLSAAQVEVLKQWIEQGAQWTAGFAFQKPAYEPPLRPRRPEVPVPGDKGVSPVDWFIRENQTAKSGKTGITTSSGVAGTEHAATGGGSTQRTDPASEGAFCRRAHLDLIGLLPEPQVLEAFVTDSHPDKRSRLVRQLLTNNVAYAEHWLTFWNDLLRNDYSGTGYIDGGRKPISAWLYQSLLQNKPYDQMVRELIAPGPESEGFARGIQWRGTVSAAQSVPVQFAQSVGQAFLGINLKCASCHDSFVDRWKLDEAYGLAAVYAEKPLEVYRCDKPQGRQASAAWLFPELGQIDASKPQAERLQQLARLMTHPENGRFTRTIVNRLWQRLMGRGIVHPTDAMQGEPWSADLLDFLATDFADHGYDLKHTLELICRSQAYQGERPWTERTEAGKSQDWDSTKAEDGVRVAKRMTAEQFVDAVWQLTGTAPAKPDAAVPHGRTETNAAQPMVRASLMKNDLLMRALGRPNREQIVSMRPNDLTTLEAMDLSNGEILASYLDRGSRKILERAWASPDAFVEWLYTFALSRPPTKPEAALAREMLGTTLKPEPVADLLWAVCLLPEFQLVR